MDPLSFIVADNHSENQKLFCSFLDAKVADIKLLQETNLVYSRDELCHSNLSNGRFDVVSLGAKFRCVYHKADEKRLYVFLSGGRTPKKDGGFSDKLPRFKRWSFYPFLNGTMLVFEDPMYYKFNNLLKGWFYGDCEVSYIAELVEVVRIIAIKNNIANENIIFYGSSSGGYAAMHACTYITSSTCIAINPQIILKNSWYKKSFETITGNRLCDDDIHSRNDTRKKILNANSNFIIIQNIFDTDCIKNHFIPFCNSLGFSPSFGLSIFKNIKTFTFAAKGGHTAYENSRLLPFILNLSKNNIEEASLYTALGMMWWDYSKK